MSVLFLPPASAASVPDATELVSGKIRIATSAEATTGTNDLTAMTPLKVKSVVDAAVVGGVTYQGTFDTSSPVDLSNAQKGDLYIISVAGSYQGQTWAVGDHLLVNADMGGTISPSKIDKVDNTDAVTSVAGKTGAVTLVAGDVSGLAAVATSGAYSDLSGTPTLATVATTGAYSDLSGTPTLGTAAAEDVGTLAGDVVQLDGSARLPAVDGSQLINLPSATVFYSTQIASLGPTLSQITDSRRQHYDIALCSPSNPITMPSATSAAVGGVVSFYNSDGVNQAVINCPTTLLLSGSSVTSVTVEPYESRSFVWIGASALQEITATRIDRLNDVSISSPSGGEALVYNGTLSVFENATIVTSVPNASETVAGIIEISTNAEATAATATDKALVPSNLSSINVSTLNNDAGYLTAITGESVGDLSDVTLTTPSAGEALVYNGTLSVFENSTISGGSSTLGALTDVDVTGAVNTNVLKYNSTSGDWEDGAVAYSEVTGKPTLGTAAAEDVGTGASNVVQLDGSARLPAVDGSQLTNLPLASLTYSSQSSSFSATENTHYSVSATTANVTATLPARSGITNGKTIRFKLYDATFNLILTPAAGDTIDGLSSYTLTNPKQSIMIVKGANDWEIV